MYKRVQYNTLAKRVAEKRRFIQVIMGPRQVGMFIHSINIFIN